MNKKGFTLIELLAVIIILGILMIIAIPSVTQYINNSRKSAYVDTAKELISGARNMVNKGDLEMFSTDTTYYIPASAIGTENGLKSPYGDFTEAYVAVTYDGKGYNYYWISVDETGQGVSNITRLDKLDEDDIESDIKASDITAIVNNTGVGKRKIIKILKEDYTWYTITENATNKVSIDGGEIIKTAAQKILESEQNDNQFNQIPGTDIYIYKGGNPANYVKFNNEDWRIIGIYGNQLKIQRVALLNEQEYAGTSNVWSTSDLKTYLNTTFYAMITDESSKQMIDSNAEWNVGTGRYNMISDYAYTSEIGTKWKGIDTSDPGIGLMASYEYLFASGGLNCLTKEGSHYNEDCGLIANNWMRYSGASWFINGYSTQSNSSLRISSSGSVTSDNVIYHLNVAPAVFLKSDVLLVSGDGTDSSHAYILQLDED